MKRIILLLTLLSYVTALYSQLPVQPVSILNSEKDTIGNTYYQVQTNATCQNRICVYDDGTIGATYTIGFNWPGFASDRGTGYNYFDGDEWNEWPEERIETERAGWPSYAPLGEEGELVVAHLSASSNECLVFSKRNSKGTGDWIESFFYGPAGHEDLVFPAMVTGGENHNNIYLLSLTRLYEYGGSPYQGLEGALVYSMSTDGGESWDILNQVLPGMDSSEYTGFTRDCYTFAEPKDNIVAFVCGSYQHDLFLMKSTDHGQTFDKTIIWDNPYDQVSPSFDTDTFYCADGSIDVTIDINGMAQVVFGIVAAFYTINDNKWRFLKLTDGIGYWNENMDSFSSNNHALDPTGHPESELVKNETLIGWAQDMDGDSTITYLAEIPTYMGHYYTLGISSMVQLVLDDQNRLFLLYSSLTETYHNGVENYRRIWLRSSINGGQTWGQFYHYDDTLYSIFNEYVYPSCASYSDDNIYLTYVIDNEPGIFWQGSSGSWIPNFICCAKVSKDEIVGIKQTKQTLPEIEVSQNFPNPFSENTTIKVNLHKPAYIKLEVVNMLGEKVYEMMGVSGNIGLNNLTINADGLTQGIYFYTVTVRTNTISKKMIIH